MATRKIQDVSRTNETDIQAGITSATTHAPSTFPPSGTYTAKSIGETFGFDASGIEKYYFPEALDIYQVCPQVLKSGNLYTKTFYDLMFLIRQHRMREKLVLNDAGNIVRHAPKGNVIGRPMLEPNQARMSKADFRAWYWNEHPELIPLVAEDSAEAVQPKVVEIEVMRDYSTPEYIEETNDKLQSTLTKTEDFGLSYQEFKGGIIQQFRNEGRALATEAVGALQDEFQSVTSDFLQALKNSTKTTR